MSSKIRFGEFTIGQAIDKMIKDFKLSGHLQLSTIKSQWTEIVGETIAKYTGDLYLRNGTLYVKCTHSALKQELNYRKKEIKEAVNKTLKEEAILDIVIN
jgi:predicted nucleic acid-binding Zn ribbon protein